jgi:SAM-dependent methyltransferase
MIAHSLPSTSHITRRATLALARATPRAAAMSSGGGGGGGARLGDHGSWDWRQQQQQHQPSGDDGGADGGGGDDGSQDAKQYAPAASRNEGPILEVLRARLMKTGQSDGSGLLLEVACGTGQHCAAFARALVGGQPGKPLSSYLPTDLTAANFRSVRAHSRGLAGVLPPRILDTSLPPERWFAAADDDADAAPPAPAPSPSSLRAMLAVNLTHISPWPATLGLLRGASHYLDPRHGLLLVYGPFTRQGGQHVGQGDGNARFDAALRVQDRSWGYRDVDTEVAPAAARAGLELSEVVEMPANNLFLVFRKES